MKTQVAIIGGGPAGLLLSEILYLHGIESVVLERKSRAHVLSRIRAGVLEQSTVDLLRAHGLSKRIDKMGQKHKGFKIVWGENTELFIDLFKYTKKSLIIYGQAQIQQDLFAAADARYACVLTEVSNVKLMDIVSEHPHIIFHHCNDEIRLDCDYIAGCDGFHGVSRKTLTKNKVRINEKIYPFSWFGVLSPTPPLSNITYAYHSRGFALASARNSMLSRYYIQVSTNTTVKDWSDDRFWFELKFRYPIDVAETIITGPTIEKSITPLRISVVEKMQHGRLFLAGDAAHILPPTGAKGLNLAVADVFYLSRAFVDFYNRASTSLLNDYSVLALRRVWHTMRTACYMTNLLHRFPDANQFNPKLQEHELLNLKSSHYAQAALAEQYAGLALE